MNALLSTTYFGPVQWYQKLYRAEHVQIERYESFQKQTFRNRCLIATTQGVQALTVPVVRGESPLITEVRISDHGNWRHLHWNALQTAYGDSPFFEYYEDDLRPFFEPQWEFLFDYNEAIRRKMCELLDIQPRIGYTEQYVAPCSNLSESEGIINMCDYRDVIQPKHPGEDTDFEAQPYYQVYRQKHGFLPNLSVLDLLMNMGPEGIFML